MGSSRELGSSENKQEDNVQRDVGSCIDKDPDANEPIMDEKDLRGITPF